MALYFVSIMVPWIYYKIIKCPDRFQLQLLCYEFEKKTSFFVFRNHQIKLVSNYFDQIGSGTPFYERTGVVSSFHQGNLLRTSQKSFLSTKTREKNLIKIGFFFRKKNHYPAFYSMKSFLKGYWASFLAKTARNSCPLIKWGTGADLIKMITDYIWFVKVGARIWFDPRSRKYLKKLWVNVDSEKFWAHIRDQWMISYTLVSSLVQSVFNNLIAIETTLLRLLEELIWQNQVHRM